MKKKTITNMDEAEITLLVIFGLIAIWGLTYLVLNIVADALPAIQSENVLRILEVEFKKSFGLGFLGWGLIIFAIGLAFFVITLLTFSSIYDRANEKETRRAARRGKLNSSSNVVEGEVK